MKPEELMAQAVIKFGSDSQIMMAFEEMAELQDAICKHQRGRVEHLTVVEEIVDVSLMLDQMRLIFDKYGDFDRIKAEKLARLQGLLT